MQPVTTVCKGKIYPAISGDRVPKSQALDYPHHYHWLYQWNQWDSDRQTWKTKSKRVKADKIHSVRYLISEKRTITEILTFIDTGEMPK